MKKGGVLQVNNWTYVQRLVNSHFHEFAFIRKVENQLLVNPSNTPTTRLPNAGI